MGVVAFDSLGTLFDLGDLAESPSFRRVLHHATCLTLAGDWRPIAEIAAAVDPELPERLQELAPKPDAREALEVVRGGGHEAWILTNGGREATEQLVERAGLTELVSRIRTVEEVQRYKPAREVYELLPGGAALVAAHGWDVTGAIAAGYRAVWVDREEGRWLLPTPEPTLRAAGLVEAAQLAVGAM